LSQKSLLQAVKKGKEFANSATKMTKFAEFYKAQKADDNSSAENLCKNGWRL